MTELPSGKIKFVSGRGLPLRGDNIDTDHMYPARFLTELNYDQVVEHYFYDERFTADGKPKDHPLNDKRYEGASVLLVNSNFGCGSGRDQGAHGFMRTGIKAIIGESYGELFLSACILRGLAAVKISRKEIELIMCAVEENPSIELSVDLEQKLVACGGEKFSFTMPDSYRAMLLSGDWDISASLMSNLSQVRLFSEKMPYLNGFKDF